MTRRKNPILVCLAFLAAAAAVVGIIFVPGEIGSRLKPANQTLSETPEAEPEHLLKILTYANIPGEKGETHALSELSDRLIAGALMENHVIKDSSGNEIPTFSTAKDESHYRDPIIILEADGKIEAEYSAARICGDITGSKSSGSTISVPPFLFRPTRRFSSAPVRGSSSRSTTAPTTRSSSRRPRS